MDNLNQQRFVIPDVLASHFHLRTGDRIADFGTGIGSFVPVLSRLVGPEGRVYAIEIQKSLVEALVTKARKEHLSNVEVIWGDLEEMNGTKIADGALDAGVMINCLFQIEDKSTAVREVWRTLRSGGKFLVVDWSDSWGGMGPQLGQIVGQADARDIVESEGFVFERTFDAGAHHYGLAFRKA
jgi:ubiquinone/menaquinone biosynthesis C-methylase UbiE